MKRFFIFLFFSTLHCFAQTRNWQHIAGANGLSHGTVFAIKQDHLGYVWMATKAGLNRYDGYNFKIFTTHSSATHTISSNQTTSLFEDSKKRLWIGSQQGDLNLYDTHTERFFHCSLKNNHIHCIEEDPQGNLWVGTLTGGIFKVVLPEALKRGGFPTQEDFTTTVKVIKLKTSLPSTVRINAFKVLKNRQLVVLTQAGYGCIDFVKNQFFPIPIEREESKRFLTIYEAADGSVVLTQPNKVFKIQSNRSEVLYETDLKKDPQIKVDKAGNVWILKQQQHLFKIHYSQLASHVLLEEPFFKSDNPILMSALEVDEEGNTWISTGGYGVIRETGTINPFVNYFKSKSIWSLFEDSQNRLITSHFRAFSVINRLAVSSELPKVILKDTHALVEDEQGNFWQLHNDSVTYNKMTLSRLNRDFQAIEHYVLNQTSTGENLGKMCLDKQGNILITGIGSAVVRFDRIRQKLDYFSYRHLAASDEVGVNSTYLDCSNTLWICSKSGLFKASPSGGYRFQAFRHTLDQSHSLADDNVSMVLDDPQAPTQYLWVATHGGGLSRLNKHDGTFVHFTTKNGLPNNYILGLLGDTDNNLWLSTYYGLAKFNTKTFACTNFTSEDGLQSNEFNVGACFKSKDGKLMFGGVNGLTVFDPKDFRNAPKQTHLTIHQLKINNQEVLPFDKTGVLSQSIEFTQELTLAHNQNQVGFGFSLIDFKSASKNRFRYQFVGIDDGWIESENQRFVNYPELSAGSYVFRVSGSLDGSQWSPPIQIKVRVKPPFYATWWAYLLYLSVVLYIIYRFYQFQINKVKLSQELAFNQKEKQRLAELDQMKTNFFANISHEFRTPLTLILSPADDLIKQYPASEYPHIIKRNANRLLQLINQILDLSKLESQQMQINASRVELVRYFRTITSAYTSLAESRQIRFLCEQNLGECYGIVDKDKVEKIITNLLSNAFKFTEKGKAVRVSISYADEYYVMTVKDEGFGIANDKLPRIFDRFYQVEDAQNRRFEGTGIGLALVKELVQVMGGRIWVESELGSGTTFYVELPLKLAVGTVHEDDADTPRLLPLESKKSAQRADNQLIEADNLLLIVDDNADIRDYIRSVFQKEYRIIEASDGLDGLNKAFEQIPNLIISDLMMPEMDGFEFCKKLKSDERTSHVPVIMLTAKVNLQTKIEGFELGADDYLVKPFYTDEVKARVKNLIEKQERLRTYFNGKTIDLKPSEIRVNSLDEAFLLKAKAVIEKYLSDSEFGAEQFAEAMNLGHRQLLRKLKALTNQTSNEFIRDFRLQRAADLLRQKAATVSEIAYQVGYENLSYFSKSFKDKFGKLPSEY